MSEKWYTRMNDEEHHALVREQRASNRHGGDKSDPHMEPDHQAEMEVVCPKPMEDKGQRESGNQAGNKRAAISRAGGLFHFLHPSFVVGIVAHLAHPRSSEGQG